jgi:hypothetical protein
MIIIIHFESCYCCVSFQNAEDRDVKANSFFYIGVKHGLSDRTFECRVERVQEIFRTKKDGKNVRLGILHNEETGDLYRPSNNVSEIYGVTMT